jgi:hypothetical protein
MSDAGAIKFVGELPHRRVHMDFNCGISPGIYLIGPELPEPGVEIGDMVTLYCDDGDTWLECEAIIRRDELSGWLAHVLEGSFRDVPKDAK